MKKGELSSREKELIRIAHISTWEEDCSGKEAIDSLEETIKDLRGALEQIAYPANHPDWFSIRLVDVSVQRHRGDIYDQRNWMASTASNALTNAGKDE